ncbi:hypothetical protein BMR10_09185 [Methylococcaceae bacterium CS4]|nr:hypothetical protein BMR10_09185 [Methylococcaceae bacterium CS4]
MSTIAKYILLLTQYITGEIPAFQFEVAYLERGVAIFAKACFGHPSPSKRQKLNATTNAFGAPDVLRTCHFAITIVNSVLAS